MAGLNKVTILGNLGKDPESKSTDSGLNICRFSVAVTEKIKDNEHTEWFDITAFGKLAEIAGRYLAKGKQVYVEGRLETRKYEDKNGQERYKTSVIAREIIFLGAPQHKDEMPPQSQTRISGKPTQQSISTMVKGVEYTGWNDTEDIPF